MTHASIYDLPDVYDQIVRPGPCEDFYAELARFQDGPVLELACGTGRLTIPLARRGHDVTGLDTSPSMLAHARKKADEEGVEATFKLGDMRSFDLGKSFALIIVSCNSLAHLADRQDLRSCLARVAGHLTPNGLLAFDITNPDLAALGRIEHGSSRVDEGPRSSSRIVVEEIGSYDHVRQLRTREWRIRETGVSVRKLAPLILRQFFPQEVALLLEAAGLEVVARFGDFERNPLTGGSPNQIYLARMQMSYRA